MVGHEIEDDTDIAAVQRVDEPARRPFLGEGRDRGGPRHCSRGGVAPGCGDEGAKDHGQRGLYKARPAFDDLMQGISGISALIGRAQGVDPQFVPKHP